MEDVSVKEARVSDRHPADSADTCLSLKDLCRELSISTATGRNWLKLSKLTPEYTEGETAFFTKAYVETLKNEIKSGRNDALKSRRNKKYISGNALYRSYVSENCKNIAVLQKMLSIIDEYNIELGIDVIQYLVADCALHLLSEKLEIICGERKFLLYQYLSGKIEIPKYHKLIDDLIENKEAALAFCQNHLLLFCLDYLYEPNEDILGLLYISCKNAGKRKAMGSYYTPTKVVKALISNLNIQNSNKILDPGCGTGNFLLQLPEKVQPDHIYGNDIDAVCVKITRLNMALKYPKADIESICNHITQLDYLTEYTKTGFDFIIGNPPWGYEFSDEEKSILKKKYQAASGKNIESYDVFIERALSGLDNGGQLSFVLPEAILNVKAHKGIRDKILRRNSITNIEFLGNAFDGVQCPCIILQIANTGMPFSTAGMKIKDANRSFEITGERLVTSDIFSFTTTDSEYAVLEKIKKMENASTLAGKADFALGIVTGNNKRYISSEKTADNETVLKGSDISMFHINPTKNRIVFQPENFQQVASTEMYRAPEKLLYRFICSRLVFAYDDKRTLSLNSCNIVIPQLEGVKIKYILAVLNSSVAQFMYKKEFNSVKVLRSHIERIPIPIVSESVQDEIIAVTDMLIEGMSFDNARSAYEKLDQLIFDVFQLTPSEREVVKLAVER